MGATCSRYNTRVRNDLLIASNPHPPSAARDTLVHIPVATRTAGTATAVSYAICIEISGSRGIRGKGEGYLEVKVVGSQQTQIR